MSSAPSRKVKMRLQITFHFGALQLMHNIKYTNNNNSSRSDPKRKAKKKLFTELQRKKEKSSPLL
jgi:hypothetical protein